MAAVFQDAVVGASDSLLSSKPLLDSKRSLNIAADVRQELFN